MTALTWSAAAASLRFRGFVWCPCARLELDPVPASVSHGIGDAVVPLVSTMVGIDVQDAFMVVGAGKRLGSQEQQNGEAKDNAAHPASLPDHAPVEMDRDKRFRRSGAVYWICVHSQKSGCRHIAQNS